MDKYQLALKDVTDMFESCGCRADVTTPLPSQVLLTITGSVSTCPSSIFEEHVDKAKELMASAHPEISFRVEVEETT